MGLSFEPFRRTKLGELKIRKQKQKTYLGKIYFWSFVIIILIGLFNYLDNVYPDFSAIVTIYKPYVFFAGFFLIGVIIYKFAKKTNTIQLNLKEQILLNLCEAAGFLSNSINNRNEEGLKDSLSSFQEISEDIERYSLDRTGFETEEPLYSFLEDLSIYIKKDLPKKLQINLSHADYTQLHNKLTNLFVYIQDEKFQEAKKLISKDVLQYSRARSLLSPLMRSIKNSILLQIASISILIILADLLTWTFFVFILKRTYSHMNGILVFAAVITIIKVLLSWFNKPSSPPKAVT